MAEERLVPNGNSTGWSGGSWEDIDEGIGSADDDTTKIVSGFPGTPVSKGQTITIDFGATGLSDGDTITRIAFDIRATSAKNSSSSDLSLQLLIGGILQGSLAPVSLTTSWVTTLDVNDSGWNSDWTATQLNGAQVRIITTQTGMPTTDIWEVTVVDLVIEYTPAGVGGDGFGMALSNHKNHTILAY